MTRRFIKSVVCIVFFSVLTAACELDVSENFEPPERLWGEAELIEHNDTGSAVKPGIAFDSEGNAVAVWLQHDKLENTAEYGDDRRADVWAGSYTPESGWSESELIETNDEGTVEYLRVAMDDSGNAMAVWLLDETYDGTALSIWSSRYTRDMGWGSPELVETEDGNVRRPQVAFDGNGDAIAVWEQKGVGGDYSYSICTNRYTAGIGWGTPEIIDQVTGYDAVFPELAADQSGNAMVIWKQEEAVDDEDGSDMRYTLRAARYTSGQGWGLPEFIEMDYSLNSDSHRISMNADGEAVVVFKLSDDSGNSHLWAVKYSDGTGWTSTEQVDIENENPLLYPRAGIDADGNVVAVWMQQDGDHEYNAWTNRYTEGSGWGTPEQLETDDIYDSKDPDIAVNEAGDAFALWRQDDRLWARQFTTDAGWNDPECITPDVSSSESCDDYQIVIDEDGNATAVWEQTMTILRTNTYIDGPIHNTRHDIWVNRFLK